MGHQWPFTVLLLLGESAITFVCRLKIAATVCRLKIAATSVKRNCSILLLTASKTCFMTSSHM